MKKKRIGCIIGTRPEVIKMAPLIHALEAQSQVEVVNIITAQHRELVDEMLALFKIQAHYDLNLMIPNQSLGSLTARLATELDELIRQKPFDLWIGQGDTTTTFMAALTAFYHHIPFAHVEAGLRSFNLRHPFPEEMNRKLTASLSHWHFAPTEVERENLCQEGFCPEQIYVTGNTVIDALYWVLKQYPNINPPRFPGKRVILVTSHRRENFGEPLEAICQALLALETRFSDIEIVYPVHPNPQVQTTVRSLLANRPRIHLISPLSYCEFAYLLQESYLILTDSGGVQEEGPALNKPILILRDHTERPALLATGTGRLVGTHAEKIVGEASRLLEDKAAYLGMAKGISPYGDGLAANRIVDILLGS